VPALPEPERSPDRADRADRDETVLDDVEDRLRFRAFFAKHPWLDLSYRVAVGLLGGAIVVLGIVLIPLPGPGWLIVFAGLAVLATEFVWAERLLRFSRRKVQGWTTWVTEQSVMVRGLIGLAGLVAVAGAVWLYDETVGLPSWVPVL
jgi:uncharacterized protein (TIGR02611 family)